ncbi:tetratricopeptide repeat protein [Terracidiphilus gabretensis]|uniref:tetratricopeptide repeat protein n=1 Tax=Terracidiphilus gabretensis TaxID=1577687 RepID=UPI00071BC7B0|nr:tetratricopeptide repeat protein [Terracidiphilus gabretensis]
MTDESPIALHAISVSIRSKGGSRSFHLCVRLFALSLFCTLIFISPLRLSAQGAASVDDLPQRATAARNSGNLPAAISLYHQAVQQKADWAEGWFYLGLLNYESDQFANATAAFTSFLKLQPGVPPVMALRGLSEFESSAYDDALRDLEQAVLHGAANDPHNEQIIRFHYAQLLTRAGRFDDAMKQYQFFADRHIENPDLLAGLGLVGTRTAILMSEVPAQQRPMLEDVGRATYTFLSGDNEGAGRLFNTLFTQYPSSPQLYLFYATLLYRDRSNLAIDAIRNEVAAMPDNGYARAVLAFTLMIAGRFAEARPEAEKAMEQKPDLEMAQIALGRCLIETGTGPSDDKRAEGLLNQVLSRDSNNLEAHMAMAALYSRTGRREDEYRERMACLRLEK